MQAPGPHDLNPSGSVAGSRGAAQIFTQGPAALQPDGHTADVGVIAGRRYSGAVGVVYGKRPMPGTPVGEFGPTVSQVTVSVTQYDERLSPDLREVDLTVNGRDVPETLIVDGNTVTASTSCANLDLGPNEVTGMTRSDGAIRLTGNVDRVEVGAVNGDILCLPGSGDGRPNPAQNLQLSGGPGAGLAL